MGHIRLHAAVIAVAGVLVVLALMGVPSRSILLGLAVLACPLAMLVMMRRMDHSAHTPGPAPHREPRRTGDRQQRR